MTNYMWMHNARSCFTVHNSLALLSWQQHLMKLLFTFCMLMLYDCSKLANPIGKGRGRFWRQFPRLKNFKVTHLLTKNLIFQKKKPQKKYINKQTNKQNKGFFKRKHSKTIRRCLLYIINNVLIFHGSGGLQRCYWLAKS